MEEEKKCEHKWKALGVEGLSWTHERGGGRVSDTYREIIGAIFCEKCGEIKSKDLTT